MLFVAAVAGAGGHDWVVAGNGPEEELLALWPTGAATDFLERVTGLAVEPGEREGTATGD